MSIQYIIPDRLSINRVNILERFHDDSGPFAMRRPRLLRSMGGLPYCSSLEKLKDEVITFARPSILHTLDNTWILACPIRRVNAMAHFIREGIHTMNINIERGTYYPTGITWSELKTILNVENMEEPVDNVPIDSFYEYTNHDDKNTNHDDKNKLYNLFTVEFLFA